VSALIARGANIIEYWHWHTLHFGNQPYWAGVLPHIGRPGRVYREIAAVGQELREASPLVSGLTPATWCRCSGAQTRSGSNGRVPVSFPRPRSTDDRGERARSVLPSARNLRDAVNERRASERGGTRRSRARPAGSVRTGQLSPSTLLAVAL
jgi:hypothetical protein